MSRGLKILRTLFSAPAYYFLPLLFLLSWAVHAPYFRTPAAGHHVWRQCNTLALARNYAEENMDILQPRVDKRYNTPGITGPEFPAYSWTLAVGYKIFGFSEYMHRWLSWFLLLGAIAGMYFLAKSFFLDRIRPSIAATFIVFAPELYYHGFSAVPDILSLAAMLWGWYFARKWLQNGLFLPLTLAILFLSLGGMVKMQFLIAGAAIGVEFLQLKRYNQWLFLGQLLLFASVVLGATMGWYLYASFLTKQYGLHEFVHAMRHAKSPLESLQILAKTLFSDIPETYVGYAFLPGFVAAIYWGIGKVRKNAIWLSYLMVCVAFYFLIQFQFLHHGYYSFIFMPLLAMMVAFGFEKLFNSKLTWLFLLLLLSPVWAWVRMSGNWQPKGYRYPKEFAQSEFREMAKIYSSDSIRWVVGPDETGCVWFYYLHAKGYPWADTSESTALFKKYYTMGARGLISNDSTQAARFCGKEYLLTLQHKAGNYSWYHIEKATK